MTSISALTGVQWTDLNGANLDAQAELEQKTFVEGLTSTQRMMANEVKDLPDGNYSFDEVMSPLYSRLNGVYLTEGEALAKLNDLKTRGIGLYQVHKMRYVDSAGLIRWAYLDDMDGGRGIYKDLVNEPFAWQDPSIVTYQPSQSSTTALLGKVLAEINSQMTTRLSPTERLSKSQWLVILDKLKQATFSEASKLKVANGGGLKTFGGKWFVNGEALSYLDIFFAVRVNQLFVVNNSITDYLGQLQKNNSKIKSANALSNMITSNTPSNSSNSVTVGTFSDAFLKEAINSGLVGWNQWGGNPVSSSSATTSARAIWTALPAGGKKPIAYLFSDSGNANKVTWVKVDINGVATTQIFDASHTEKTMVNDGYSLRNMAFSTEGLRAVMPSTYNKLFDQWGGIMLTASLTQTDCNSMTTEFKAYTSAVDSQSQLLQTQLTQYNDKRAEVLDDMSSIVKGNTSVMTDVARNSGAV